MKIYNTLTRQKEEFIPLDGNKVKMYACGITVSGEAHIGHAFQALIYDVMRKYLENKGYSVTYARNYTDVDDKIIAKSRETGIPADVYAADMIRKIDAEMHRFQVDDPTVWLKATGNIENIVDFISRLIEKGHAYATEKGDVYFSVESFPAYGQLSNRSLEDAISGVRIDSDENKRNALDFALWKSAKEDEICWDSPWGKGRPGWHIECSAMNRAAFGDQIDLHGGGRDLIFPHHENEIAQTEALTGKRFAKYWTHNGLIKVNGQKMSKSLGNSLLLSDLLDRYSEESLKFALLSNNYRNDVNVTDDLFPAAERHLADFYRVFLEAEQAGLCPEGGNEAIDAAFDAAMDDDFNTARALSDLFGYFKEIRAKIKAGDRSAADDLNQIRKTYGLLGLFRTDPATFLKGCETRRPKEAIPPEVIALAEERLAARREKNWAKSDELRDKIAAAGYTVKDGKDGYTLENKQR